MGQESDFGRPEFSRCTVIEDTRENAFWCVTFDGQVKLSWNYRNDPKLELTCAIPTETYVPIRTKTSEHKGFRAEYCLETVETEFPPLAKLAIVPAEIVAEVWSLRAQVANLIKLGAKMQEQIDELEREVDERGVALEIADLRGGEL